MRGDKVARVLRAISGFFVLFAIVAVVVTLSVSVFLGVMASSSDIEYTRENISDAAKATMLCTVLITSVFYVIDAIRRYYTVRRPAEKIIEATERIMHGDFSYRIEISPIYETRNEFDEIACRINKMADALSSTETLRTDFIANVSHEIKTPLAVMSNYASLLRDDGLDEEKRREYVAAISSASQRLSSLVSNILRLNKLENQQITPNMQKYDLSEQLCECILQFESVWEEREIELDADIDEDIYVKNDPEMMSLVWNNLLSNALKFTESGGRVTVNVRSEGDFAVVRIEDTGCGISPEVGERIFEKFYQGDLSHTGGGNGLGLSLVKRVIDITKSTVSVESKLGEGSAFTVKMRRDI